MIRRNVGSSGLTKAVPVALKLPEEVALVITCHEAYLPYLPKLIETWDKLLNDNWSKRYLVLDGCDYDTPKNWRVIKGEWGEPGAARNEALKHIKRGWVVFWDADNMPTTRLVQEYIKSNIDDNNAVGVYAPRTQGSLAKSEDINRRPCVDTASMWRVQALRNIGGWSEDGEKYEDGDLAIRLAYYGWKIVQLSAKFEWNAHGDNRSRVLDDRKGLFRIHRVGVIMTGSTIKELRDKINVLLSYGLCEHTGVTIVVDRSKLKIGRVIARLQDEYLRVTVIDSSKQAAPMDEDLEGHAFWLAFPATPEPFIINLTKEAHEDDKEALYNCLSMHVRPNIAGFKLYTIQVFYRDALSQVGATGQYTLRDHHTFTWLEHLERKLYAQGRQVLTVSCSNPNSMLPIEHDPYRPIHMGEWYLIVERELSSILDHPAPEEECRIDFPTLRKDGDFGFVVTYFNICEYDTLRKNFEDFLERWEGMSDRFIVVEVAFFDQPFVMQDKAKNIIQLRSGNVMWQKEAMINVGTKYLRQYGFKNVGWLDGDTEYKCSNEEWYDQVVESMKTNKLVQSFEHIDHQFSNTPHDGLGCIAEYQKYDTHPLACQRTGLGWMVDGEVWDECGGWYDLAIMGAGDRLAFVGAIPDSLLEDVYGVATFLGEQMEGQREVFHRWADKWRVAIDGQIGYLEHIQVLSHPHGRLEDRNYYEREVGLRALIFNPDKHIVRDGNGLLKWSDEATVEMKNFALSYFVQRKDDD